jgi:hypothetical protein
MMRTALNFRTNSIYIIPEYSRGLGTMKKKEEPPLSRVIEQKEIVDDLISPYFRDDSEELSGLMSLNKEYYTFFKEDRHQRLAYSVTKYLKLGKQNIANKILEQYPEIMINLLLYYIASGNQDEVEKILTKHPELLLEYGSVTDFSMRMFKGITPLKLVMWTMDVRYMADKILNYIPNNEKGEKIRENLILQFNEVQQQGVKYRLNNVYYTESYFDINPLITELIIYIKNYKKWNYNECTKQWCKIGKMQIKLPANFRQHLCDTNISLVPTPTFEHNEFKRSLKFSNVFGEKEKDREWGSDVPNLGVHFGIFRGDNHKAITGFEPYTTCPTDSMVEIDLLALTTLYKKRINDYERLKKKLMYPQVPLINNSANGSTIY